jgi:hypothetical protein
MIGKPQVSRPHKRPRYRWDSNIKMDVKEIGLESVDWIHQVRDRDVVCCKHCSELSGSINRMAGGLSTSKKVFLLHGVN